MVSCDGVAQNLSAGQPGAEEACVTVKEISVTEGLRWDNRKMSSHRRYQGVGYVFTIWASSM